MALDKLVGYGVKGSGIDESQIFNTMRSNLYDGHIFYKDDVTKTEKEELKEYLKEDTDIRGLIWISEDAERDGIKGK